MENEKIVEEKNVEKKPKHSPIPYVIAILILAAIAYAYFCTDIIRTRPVSQEGSQFVGTYERELSSYPNYTDLNNVPIQCTLILEEDGTGSFREYNDNGIDGTASVTWKEVNGTAEIVFNLHAIGDDDPKVLTKKNDYYTINYLPKAKWFKTE